jgi:benzoate membrane transport protein
MINTDRMVTSPALEHAMTKSLSPIVAGIIAVVVGYAGPTVLAFEVARRTGMPTPQIISWFWAYSMASGVAGLYASWRWRIPVVLAWSTPGLGILGAALAGHTAPEAIGAYLLVGLIITLMGMAGLFERLTRLIPQALAAAVLAGVLFPFVLKVSGALTTTPMLVGAMVLAFVIMRSLSARWMIAAVTAVGIGGSALAGQIEFSNIDLSLAVPQLITPSFSIPAFFDIALPMLLVTLSGQYLPGLAILKANGYTPPADALVRLCGLASILSAPFGNHTINPAAIIAGIAAGPDSHPDPNERWMAGVSAGVTYILFGSFAGTFVALFAALPPGLVPALAGLALLGTVTSSLSNALNDQSERDAALVTFAVTVSGVTVFGMSAALWGLAAGLVMRATGKAIESWKRRKAA